MTVDDDFKYLQLHGVDVEGEDWQVYRSMKASNNVSGQGPDWMKSPFDNNRRFFEEQGPPPSKPDDGKPSAGGESDFFGRPKAVKRSGHVHSETGKVLNRSIVSTRAPDFFKSPFESNREYFEKEMADQVQDFDVTRGMEDRQNKATRKDKPAGVHSEWRRGNWLSDSQNHGKSQNTVQASGRVCNSSVISVAAPAFMKSPFESNRAHFEEQGVVQKLKPGAKSKMEGAIDGSGVTKGGINRRCEETGCIWNHSITSREAPHFMKSPFESNRAFFEERGVAQKVKMSPRLDTTASTSASSRSRGGGGNAGLGRPKSAPSLTSKSQSARKSVSAASGGGHRHSSRAHRSPAASAAEPKTPRSAGPRSPRSARSVGGSGRDAGSRGERSIGRGNRTHR